MGMPVFDLYNFFNSSSAYRVRIALGLKHLEWRHIGVNVRAGEQYGAGYAALNPNRLVPLLRDGAITISQSLAIIDYLDQVQPEPLLIPRALPERMQVMEIALMIACDLHPLNNMRVQKFLAGPMQLAPKQKDAWVSHWFTTAFDALEQLLPAHDGWAVGAAPTLADCCIVPQVANALRASYSMAAYPNIMGVYDHCQRHPAFAAAAPQFQPDYIAH